MTLVRQLLFDLVEDGVDLRWDGEKLRYRTKVKMLRADLAQQIADNRDKVIAYLAARPHATPVGIADTISRTADLPLSFSQERFWFLNKVSGGNDKFAVSATVEIEGVPDLGLLERSLNDTIARHENLRTVFVENGDRPVQKILPLFECPVEHIDLSSAVHGSEQDAEMQRLVAELSARPFDLENGPLLRVRVIQVRSNAFVLVICLHHIITDGWSMGLLIRDVTQCYIAYRLGLENPLPLLEVQYADYALWQRHRLVGGYLSGQLSYWRDQLRDAPPMLELPTDHVRPAMPSFEGAAHGFVVSSETTLALHALSRRHDATLYMVVLAAFQLLLGRWSGQSDVVVGSPVSGRTHRELEDLVGLFVNMLAMRTDLSGDLTFEALLLRVKATALAAYSNQDVPFEQVVAEVAPERDLRRQPLFQAVLSMLNMPTATLAVEGLRFSRHAVQTHASSVDLTLYVTEADGALQCVFEYATDLFDAHTIARLAGALNRLLAQVAARPAALLSSFDLIDPDERRWLLETVNDTRADYRTDQTLDQLVMAQAQRRPDATALRCGTATMSYGELDRLSNGLALQLQAMGVGPDVIVGICAERSMALIVGVLGILKAGGTYLPIDPAYPSDRIAYMLDDARCPIVLATETARDQLPATAAIVIPLETIQPANNPPQNPAKPHNLAYVIYTSGSTGKPKGVMTTHANASNRVFLQSEIDPFQDDSICAMKASIGFVDSIYEIFCPLARGLTLAIFPHQTVVDAESFLEGLETCRVNHLITVPAQAQALLQTGQLQRLQALKSWTISGDELSCELLTKLRHQLAHCRFINMYGASEFADAAAIYIVGDPLACATVPIGRPAPNTRLHVLDGALNMQPIGVVGEIYVAGAGVTRGYLNRPELTDARFLPDPFGPPGTYMYRTGDLGCWSPAGIMKFLGRSDRQVKIRGFRVELGEVESALSECPGVAQAVAVARPDRHEMLAIRAYLVSADGQQRNDAAIWARLKSSLPGHMMPASLTWLEAFPLNSSGKIDRRALPEPAEAMPADCAPASTELQSALVKIWCEVLKRDAVGVHQDFFEAGGHSLLAAKAIARVRKLLGRNVPINAIFDAPSPAALAIWLDHDREGQLPSSYVAFERLPRPENLPLSFPQERLWFLRQFQSAAHVYNIPVALCVDGGFDLGIAQAALDALVSRHEVLRTRFVRQGSDVFQIVDAAGTLQIELIDLTGSKQVGADLYIDELIAKDTRRPFDLENGPIVRAACYRVSESQHILYFVGHHIISDGWSMANILSEMMENYISIKEGGILARPLLEVQYADYALWQRHRLVGGYLSGQLSYWRDQLRDAPPMLELPTDHVRPAMPSFEGAAHGFVVSSETTLALHALSRRHDATLYMVVLAAFQLLLGRWSGQSDVVVGSPVSGRTHRELEDLVGLFVNMLAMRTDLSGDLTFEALLLRVKATALAAYSNQDVPFEQVVAEVAPERDLRRQPLFQAVLSMLNMPTATLAVEGLRFSRHAVQTHASSVDLTLYVTEADGALQCVFEYATDLFDAHTIARLAGALNRLLAQVAARPAALLSSFDLIDPDERRWLLETVNDTRADYRTDQTLDQLVMAQAQRRPDATALRCGTATMSYGELDRLSNGLALQLQAMGVGPDVIVGICAERSMALIVGVLGILKAGGTYLPIDPAYPSDRIAYMLDDARCPIVLATETARDQLPATAAIVIPLETIQPANNPPQNPAKPHNLAYVIYTSGSTGKPKGVMVPHRAPVNHMIWMQHAFPLQLGDAVLFKTSPSFDASVWEIFDALVQGGTMVIADANIGANPHELLAIIKNFAIKKVQFVPASLRAFIDHCSADEQTALQAIFCGGGALPHDLAVAAQHKFGVPVVNLYGPTETCIQSTFWVGPGSDPTRARASEPIGRPISNTRVYVLDGQLGLQPCGVPGELCIGGAGVAAGYVNDPSATAEKFVPDPFGPPGDRLYRTGDKARWTSHGQLEFLGRSDTMVKLRGFRVELGEIETLLRRHSAVRDCFVTILGDGTSHAQLVAALVCHDDEPIDPKAIRAFLAKKLPDYMLPSRFAVFPALPALPNGKIDGKRVVAALQQKQTDDGVADLTPTQTRVAAIWAQILGTDHVSQSSDFFESGGNSIHSITVVAEVKQEFGVDMPLRLLFEHPRLDEFCAALEDRLSQATTGGWADQSADTAWQSVGILRPGAADSRPLFCIPPSPGLNWVYAPFANALPADQRVIGLQATDIAENFPATVPALAGEYFQLIKAAAPHGPYRLLGYSLGGLVAHHVAHLLEADGETVEWLCLGDSEHADAWGKQPPPSDRILFDAVLDHWGLPARATDLPEFDLAVALRKFATSPGIAPLLDEDAMACIVNLLRGHAALDRGYTAPAISADIIFLGADDGSARARSRPDDWRTATTGKLMFHCIQTVHNRLFTSEFAKTIAELIIKATIQ
jgi:pristinamycin I synthase-3/4